jgi:hypothetical protein
MPFVVSPMAADPTRGRMSACLKLSDYSANLARNSGMALEISGGPFSFYSAGHAYEPAQMSVENHFTEELKSCFEPFHRIPIVSELPSLPNLDGSKTTWLLSDSDAYFRGSKTLRTSASSVTLPDHAACASLDR